MPIVKNLAEKGWRHIVREAAKEPLEVESFV